MLMKKNIKIAVFHLAFVYSGGGEKLVLKEVKKLKQRGYEVDLFACAKNSKKCFPDKLKKEKVNLFLPWTKNLLPGHEAFWVLLSCILAPLYAYKFRHYNVIFAANQPSLWIASVIKKLYKVPFIAYIAQPTRFLHPRDVDKQTGLYFVKKESQSISVKVMRKFIKVINILDIFSFKSANIVLVNGKYMKDKIEKVYKIKALNCPAGTDTIKTIVEDSRRQKNPYILMTNRHAWQKRLEYGLTAFSAISVDFPKLKLIITGEPTAYTQELKVIVKRMGLEDRVDFVGYVKDKDLTEIYKLALCYLYTAPEEDFGMGIVEGMGVGTPVVAWNKAGPSKIIQNNVNGLLAKPNDVGDFTGKVLKIIENKKLRVGFGQNALESVKQNYSWKNHISIIEKSINFLLE